MEQKKKSSWSKKLLIGFGIIIALYLIGKYSGGDEKPTAQAEEPEKVIQINEVLESQYFQIQVGGVDVRDKVGTGNQFAEPPNNPSTQFVVIDAAFRNTDTESRMLLDGSLFINVDGKEYEFDSSEPIMLEGWGASLTQVNPLVTTRSYIVYRVPKDIKGPMHWQPGRTYGEDQRIYLGDL